MYQIIIFCNKRREETICAQLNSAKLSFELWIIEFKAVTKNVTLVGVISIYILWAKITFVPCLLTGHHALAKM